MRVVGSVLVMALSLCAAGPAQAGASGDGWDEPSCVAGDPVPDEWAAWDAPEAGPQGPILPIGGAYDIRLKPVEDVGLEGFVAKELPADSTGASYAFTVSESGTWAIGVADPMWIDVIGPDGPLESTVHGHFAQCWGVTKAVGFELAPGTYRLELSAAQVRSTSVMITRLP